MVRLVSSTYRPQTVGPLHTGIERTMRLGKLVVAFVKLEPLKLPVLTQEGERDQETNKSACIEKTLADDGNTITAMPMNDFLFERGTYD